MSAPRFTVSAAPQDGAGRRYLSLSRCLIPARLLTDMDLHDTEQAAQAELERYARLCPDLTLEVLPLTLDPEAQALSDRIKAASAAHRAEFRQQRRERRA